MKNSKQNGLNSAVTDILMGGKDAAASEEIAQASGIVRSKPRAYALEPRILFDGAALITAVSADTALDQQPTGDTAHVDTAVATTPATATADPGHTDSEQPENIEATDDGRIEVVFIDSALPDYQTLVDSVPEGTEIYIVEEGVDGWAYMAEVLEGRSDIDAIHVLGHGSEGNASLGDVRLNSSSLAEYSDELAAIGSALTAEGDILLYGCDIAAGDAGVDFIGSVAELSGADVAASDDLTGVGGDWDLELETASIETNEFEFIGYEHDLWLTNGDGYAGQIGQNLQIAWGFTWGGELGSVITIEATYLDINRVSRTVSTTYTTTTADGEVHGGFMVSPYSTYPPGATYLSDNFMTRYSSSTGNLMYSSVYHYTFIPNIAPTVDLDTGTGGNNYTTSWTEGDSAVSIANASDIVDADSDTEVQSLTVTLTNDQEGADEYLISTVSNANITVTGSGTDTITLTEVSNDAASTADYEAVLNGIQWVNNSGDDPNTTQRTLSVVANDGTANSSTAYSYITVNAVNDAPTMSATGSNPTFTEDGALAGLFSGSAIDTIEAGQTVNGLTLTVTNVADTTEYLDFDGTSIALSDGASGVSNNLNYAVAVAGGTATVTISGSVDSATMQSLINNMAYRNSSQAPTTASRVVTLTSIQDGGGTANGGVDTTALNISSTVTVVAVNDDPTMSGIPASLTVLEDVASNINLSAATFADIDSASGAVSLRLSVDAGTLAASSGGGVSVSGSGSATLTLSGTAAAIDSYLNTVSNIQYTTPLNASGSATLSLIANDGGNTGSGGGTDVNLGSVTLNISATNDDPTASGIPVSLTVVEDLASNINLSGVTLADVDAATGAVILTLTADAGTLAAFSGGGVTIGGSGTGTLSLAGTLSALNTYLDTASNIQYTTALNAEGSATLTLTANDQDNTGSGGGTNVTLGSVTLNINPVNDAPVLDLDGAGGSANHTTDFGAGGDPIVVTDTDATLVDVDSGDLLASLTAVLAATPDGASEALGLNAAATLAASGAGLTVNYSSATRTLSVSGSASASVYQTILRGITYSNGSDPLTIDGSDRVVSISVNDGDVDSNVPTSTISIVSAPLVDIAGDGGTDRSGTATFTEQTPQLVAPSATVTEADGDNLNQLVIVLTNSQGDSGEQIVINGQGNGSVVNGITITYDSASQITLSGSAAATEYQTVLRSLQYLNTSDSPAATARLITVQGRDVNGLFGNTAELTVSITQVNDAPTLDLDGVGGSADFSTEFGAGGNPVLVTDTDASLVELDIGDQIDSLTAVLTATPDGANEALGLNASAAAVASGAGLTVGYSSATRTLSVTGTASVADYQDILRGIVYSNSTHPVILNGTNRLVTITVNDGLLDSNAAVSTIDIVNSPLIDWTGDGGIDSSGTASFTEQTPLLIAPTATVAEGDGDNLNQMVIVLTNSQGDSGEQIVINGQGNGSVVNGITITYDSASQITLSGSATAADYQTVLQSLQYLNTSDDPDTTARVITVQGRDVNGMTGNTASLTVSMTTVNDEPTLSVTADDPNFVEGTPITLFSNANASVIEAGQSFTDLRLTVTNIAVGTDETLTLDGTDIQLAHLQNGTTATNGLSYWVSITGTTATLSFSGGAMDAAQMNALINGITYRHNSEDPTATGASTRDITLTYLADDGGTANGGDAINDAVNLTSTVTIVPLNDAPVMTAGAVTSYTENDPAQVIDDTITISDVDDTQIGSASVVISSGLVVGDVLGFVDSGSITGSYNAGTGTLTLSGTATLAEYQAALRTVSFVSSSENPTNNDTETSRTISWSVTDADSDGAGAATSLGVTSTINITPLLDAPIITSNSGGDFDLIDIDEHATAVTDVDAIDPDGTNITYSIAGPDAHLFDIDVNSGVLIFNITPNYEAPADVEGDNVYQVTVTATDEDGEIDSQDLSVRVNDLPVGSDPYPDNRDPSFITGTTATIPENTATVMTVVADDPDGNSVTYSITGSDDDALFQIDATSGELSFITAPDFEHPLDANVDNDYLVSVTGTDSYGATVSQTITVTVTDLAVGAGPVGHTEPNNTPQITSDGAGDTAAVSVAENSTAVTTVTATDPDADNAALTYSLSGGADQGRFIIDGATGVLSFLAAPNFEAPADANGDNVYVTEVTVTDDHGATDIQTISVTVTDVTVGDPNPGNQAPVINSGNSFNIDENLTDVGSVVASDPDGHGIVYSISGGEDAALFQIDQATGALSFLVAPDYENPTDLGDTAGNNSYVVEVTVSDNQSVPLTATQTITVTVNDVNVGAGPVGNTEPNSDPVITSDGGGDTAAVSVAENSAAVTTVTATDADADNTTLTYSLSGGADQGRFAIDGTTGALSFLVAPNFEAPADADGDNIYAIEVAVTDDHGGIDTQTISVTVSDVTGVGDTTPGNRLPLFSSGTTASVPENTTAVMTVAASDPDGQAVSYAIAGGADAASFQIESATGALSFVAAPDFEIPADVNRDNDYEVTVSATDTSGGSQNQSLVVTVTDVAVGAGPVGGTEPNNAPQITSDGGGDAAAVSVAENSTAVTTVTATDPDTDNTTLTYSLTGGADQGRFTIDGVTGAVSFLVAPNFEAAADVDGDNVYQIEVTVVDDHGATDIQTISVTVTDLIVGDPSTGNESPVIGSGNSFNIDENLTEVGSVVASDPDGHGIAYSISGGEDAALFQIDETTGALSFLVAPDYENPTDLGDTAGNNTYVVEVTVTDNYSTPLSATQTITVTVNDVNVGAGPVGRAEPNNAPMITSDGGGDTAAVSVAENSTAVTTVTATDADADNATLTYSLSGGADQSRFIIDGATGALSFLVAPNFEAPADADGDNVYELAVTVSDDHGATDIQTINITVTDVVGGGDTTPGNRAPVISSNGGGATASVDLLENNSAVTTVIAADPDGQDVSYTIVGGADADKFNIDTATGALRFNVAPNFEAPSDSDGNNIFEVVVQASDSQTPTAAFDTQSITVNLLDDPTVGDPVTTNQNPTINSSAVVSVEENTLLATTVTAIEPDGQDVSYSLSGGVDQGKFTIDADTGALSFLVAPNFEAPADADGNNVYHVEVTASDGYGGSDIQTITITVTDVVGSGDPTPNNRLPIFSSGDTTSVPENTTAVMTVAASDPDGQDVSYAIIGGSDAGLFDIDAGSGALSFQVAPNFEAPADVNEDNVYELSVEVTDASGGTATQNITITVTDVSVGDPSTGNEAPVIGSGNSFNIDENLTDVGSVVASDPDGHGITYSISGGADAALFQIDQATGALSFQVAPDYENPTDLGDTAGNNTYVVEVTVTDNYSTPLSATQTITVTVNDINVGAGPVGHAEPNNAPMITSDGGGDIAAVSVAENSTAVTTVTATDRDADNTTLTYSLSGGADQGRFTIDGATGALSFLVAPNFEAPADADGDNVYELAVTVTDDHGGTDIQTISVTVTDVTVGDPSTANEAPFINSGNSFNIDENLTDVGAVVASDPDGHSIVYNISGGADAALFRIDNTTGALSFLVAPDYENPTDLGDTAGNNTYVVEVTVSDSYSTPLTATQIITVTVNDLSVGAGPIGNPEPNNDPLITSDGGGNTAMISVVEHTTAVTTVTATDADADNIGLTYSILGGVDADRFTLDANTGALSFLVGPDYEAPADANNDNVYQVQVAVTDDVGGTDIQTLTISVTDVVVGDPSTENDAPVFTSNANVSVMENNLTATTLTATDPDGHALSYSMVGGVDADSFTLDSDSGVLNFHVAPNFEAPADSNLDGIYTLTVQVDDAHGGVTTQNLTITVTNDLTGADPSTTNQAPIFTSPATRSVQENSITVGAVTASDPDGQRITFSISGGADAASFTIDPTTGELQFVTTPNYEAPHDADADNVYELMVNATDAGGVTTTQNMLITVSDVNEFVSQPPTVEGEAPVFTSEAIRVVPENSVALGAVTASDPDGEGVTFAIIGGADAASFSIDPTTGSLQFTTAPDFENPHDVGMDNIYELMISATDESGDQSTQRLQISVTDLDESTNHEPVITSVDSFQVTENTTAVGAVTASDPDGEPIFYAITGGADAASFTIDAATGFVSFNTMPNFEDPHDVDGNNRYELSVTVTDASGGLTTQNLAITVLDIDEPTDNHPQPQPQPPTNNNPPLQPDGQNGDTSGSEGDGGDGVGFNDVTGADDGLPGQDFESEDGGGFLLGDYATEGNQDFRTLTGEMATNTLSPFHLFDFDAFGRARSDVDELYTKPGIQAFRVLVTEAEQPSLFVFHGMRDLTIETDVKSIHVEVPVDAFTHTDRNANVFLYASLSNGQPLPEWIGFDPVKGIFSGVIPDGLDVDVVITVTAVDGEGRTASFSFSIKVAETQQKSGFTEQLRMHSAVVTRG